MYNVHFNVILPILLEIGLSFRLYRVYIFSEKKQECTSQAAGQKLPLQRTILIATDRVWFKFHSKVSHRRNALSMSCDEVANESEIELDHEAQLSERQFVTHS